MIKVWFIDEGIEPMLRQVRTIFATSSPMATKSAGKIVEAYNLVQVLLKDPSVLRQNPLPLSQKVPQVLGSSPPLPP